MRKVAAALFFIAALGMLAPPVFAQAPAPAPAPKVTINGLGGLRRHGVHELVWR